MSKWFTLDGDIFAKALKRVSFAVAKEGNPKFTFTAICMLVDKDKILLMGSNSHRISIGKIEIETGVSEPRQLLMSPNAMNQIPKIFDGDFQFYIGQNSVIAKSGPNTIFVRLINGQFPDVSKVMPRHPNKLIVDSSAFLAQVNKASLALNKNSTLVLSLEKNKMTLSSKTRIQRRSANVEWEIPYSGVDIKFALNSDYLKDVLKVAESGPIKMEFNENNHPLLFTQPSFRYLMVPQEI